MQLPSLYQTLVAAQTLLGAVSATVIMAPRVAQGVEKFNLTAEVAVLPAGHGYQTVPTIMDAPTNELGAPGLEKRGAGCRACQW